MSAPDGDVPALVSLIVNAAKAIEAQYTKSSKPFVPSLNDLTPHPLDSQFLAPEIRQATQILEGACAQLTATLGRPQHTIVNRFMGIYESGCLHVAITFKIPDILEEAPNGMHISELAKKSGVDEEKLGRVLRLLASKHIFREVKKNVFANNRLSLQILSTNPLSSLAFHFADENNKATTVLPDVLADPVWGPSRAPEHSPFSKAHNYPGTLFGWYEGVGTPEGGKQGARFGRGMIGWGDAIEAGAVITEFPWADLAPGSTVCDVGGGIGTISMQLARKYPHLQVKLQDTPERIVQAQTEVWPQECPEAIQGNRIEFKAMDFLAESPIKGCDIYYLKNIVHDWPDKNCVTILSGVRAAMKPTSRVLIQEYVLQHADREADEDSAFKQAPEPLLPNYGVGRIRQYNLDLDMMVMLNSKERTLEEFIQIGKEAGLKFVKLWNAGDTNLVEFGPAN